MYLLTPGAEMYHNNNPYIKVRGCLSVCLSVAKDLANHWTDMIDNVDSHRSQKGL